MTLEEAIDIVARKAIALATDDITHEDYPEIGEDDWQRVDDRITDLVTEELNLENNNFVTAYAVLEARARK